MFEDEQPEYILTLSSALGEEIVCEAGDIDIDIDQYALLAFTDRRILIVVNQKRGDNKYSIPFDAVEDVYVDSGFLKHKLVIETKSGNKLRLIGGGSKSLKKSVASYVEMTEGVMQDELEESHHPPEGELKSEYVCRKCKQKIDQNANRCPHCGFAPKDKKKGALWHATGLATSFSPIGWAMMAKGTEDEMAARESVGEELENVVQSQEETEQSTSPLDKIEKLAELRDTGAISEEEYEEKKKNELLDRV